MMPLIASLARRATRLRRRAALATARRRRAAPVPPPPAQFQGLEQLEPRLMCSGSPIGEAGFVTVDQPHADAWHTVTLARQYVDPVVVVSPAADAGWYDSAMARVRNVTGTSFDVQTDEWDSADGGHYTETYGYLVVEAGRHALPNGAMLEAGVLDGVTHEWQTRTLADTVVEPPTLLTQVVTVNESDAVTMRLRHVTGEGFQLRLQEQESKELAGDTHAPEQVAYLAVSHGVADGFEAGRILGADPQTTGVNHTRHRLSFADAFDQTPVFLAQADTFAGSEPFALRYGNLTADAVDVYLHEERSVDTELKHVAEEVGYLALPAGTLLAHDSLPNRPPTTPAQPTLAATPYTSGVHLTWAAPPSPDTPPDRYLIEWSPDGTEWFAIDEVDGTQTHYLDEYPVLGESYYAIRAVDELHDPSGAFLDSISSALSAALAVTPIAPPVAWADTNAGTGDTGTLSPFSTPHATPVALDVLANDIDYDNSGSLSIHAITTAPAHGTVAINPNQTLTYTPDPGFVGTDTFQYTITDGQAVSAPANVAVDVTNTAPVAQSRIAYYNPDVFFRASENGSGDGRYDQLHVAPGGEQGLAAVDADGDALTYHLHDGPEHGEVTIDPDTGGFVYTPHASFPNLDHFSYVVDDGLTRSAPASVTVDALKHYGTSYSPSDTWYWGNAWYLRDDLSVGVLGDGTLAASRLSVPWDVQQPNTSLGIELIDPPSQGTFAPAPTTDHYIYTPDADFTGSDTVTFAFRNGALRSKPVTARYTFVERPTDPSAAASYENGLLNGYGTVWPIWEAAHAEQATEIYPVHYTLETIQEILTQPQHGTLTYTPNRETFIYTPHFDPASGDEPYLGVDVFSYAGHRHDKVLPAEQWFQINVTYDVVPTPPPSLPAPWVPVPFNGSFSELETKLETVKQKRLDILRRFEDLGEVWETVDSEADLPAEDVLDQAEDISFAYDAVQAAYDAYLAGRLELQGNVATYLGSWSATASLFYDSNFGDNALENLVNEVGNLSPYIGGLKPGADYSREYLQVLDRVGDAAGFQSDFYARAYEIAETTHNVLEVVETGGALLTGGTYTAATLATKAGFKALIKTVARNYIINKATEAAITPLMNTAMTYAAEAGVSPTYLQVGMLAMQTSGLVKAAKGKVRPCGNSFVAGTGVVVKINQRGKTVTRDIAKIKVGDLVLARDQHDPLDDLDRRRVTHVSHRTSDHIRVVEIAGDRGNVETLETTDEHPFYVDARGWVHADELRKGDLVQEADGTWQTVLSTLRVDYPHGITVYNLEVEGDHTYFVDDGYGRRDAVWVHNACGNLKKLDNKVIKAGVDAHQLKLEFVGSDRSRFNIAEDSDTGKLYLIPVRPGAAPPIPLNMTLEEARQRYPRQ